MPKATIQQTPAARASPVPSKQAQRKANSARITALLHEIRVSSGLGRSFKRPAVNPDEYCTRKPAMFTGTTESVNSLNHPSFIRLGQLYYRIFCANSNEFERLIWDPRQIPRVQLESHTELKNLLVAREMLKPTPRSEKQQERVGSCGSPSASCSSRTPQNSSASTMLVISSDESDVKITPIQRGLPKLKKLETQCLITLYVFTQTDCNIQSTCPTEVKLQVPSESFIALEHLAKQLNPLGLKPSSHIDQYIRFAHAWSPIFWNTPFRVKNNTVITLKLSGVEVKDWNIHAPHLFE